MINIHWEKNINLFPHTTWKLGGPAKYFTVVKTEEEMVAAVSEARKRNLPFFILGSGSNILISDEGYEGLVIKNEIEGMNFDEESVTAGSGVAMGRLAVMSMQKDLSGLEWAIGLPGTVGGAVFGNSNCFGGSTGTNILSVKLLGAEGKIKKVNHDYFDFSYDYSVLQKTKEIVLEATFGLKKISPEEMMEGRKNISKVAAERVSKQPLGAQVAGSVFKAIRPTEVVIGVISEHYPKWKDGLRDGFISAGFIIDKVLHLKGHEQGKMKISPLHANFFMNLGGATALEARELIDFVKNKCQNILSVELEEEIKYLGKF